VDKKISPRQTAKRLKPGLGALFFKQLCHCRRACNIVVIVFTPFLFSDKMLYGSDTMAGLDSRVFLKNSLVKSHQFPQWFSSRLAGCRPSTPCSATPCIFRRSCSTLPSPFTVRSACGSFSMCFWPGCFSSCCAQGFKIPAFIAGIGAAFYMLNRNSSRTCIRDTTESCS